MSTKSDHSCSSKSGDSKKNMKKKLSNAKIISGICNTAFTLEEKLQSKGYSNFKNSEDAKSSDEDANTSTVSSTINSPNIDLENEAIRFNQVESRNQSFDNAECASCRNPDKFVDDKDCDIGYAESTNKEPRKNSDIRSAIQNLNQNLSSSLHSMLTNSTSNKSAKCTTPQSDHKSHRTDFSHPNSINCLHNGANLDDHNVEMPATEVQAPYRNKIWTALKGKLTIYFN